MIHLAVDCMGGDIGIAVTIPASISFLDSHVDCALTLVGREAQVRAALSSDNAKALLAVGRLKIKHAEDVVAMDDAPAVALRTKKQSSIRIGAELVRDGNCGALVSAGNTGALMAISRFVLKMLDGIDRPAIAAQLPQSNGAAVTMLDLGANVDCTPEHLLQFGIMGAALVSALDNKDNPSVGLLNIGEELIKGNEIVKRAGELLSHSGLNFIGNVEGNDIYKGKADVVVCDGFVGNVALKTSEGLAQMVGQFIKEEFLRTPVTKFVALLAAPILRRFKSRLDHRRYNGASLIGLRGVVIKSHGGADAFAFEHALRRAYDAVHNDLLGKISRTLSQVMAAEAQAGELALPSIDMMHATALSVRSVDTKVA
jgi:phosphate acyltransferase